MSAKQSPYHIVIPARYASERLPGKILLELAGKPLIQHVWQRAIESSAESVIIATDDERIVTAAKAFGAEVVLTRSDHQSGSDRIAECANQLGWSDDQLVVNLQGDEPTMPAILINQCAALLDDATADIATLASPFLAQEDFLNPNCVKVVRDTNDHAIYFSRAAIPYPRDTGSEERAASAALHHHGIYAYRCGVLRQFVAANPSELEVCEQLEQLRALSLGMTIAVGVPSERLGAGVDTEDDLLRAAAELTRTIGQK